MISYFIILLNSNSKSKETVTTQISNTSASTDSSTNVDNGTNSSINLQFEEITDFRTYSKHASKTSDIFEHDVKAGGWAFGVFFNIPYNTSVWNLTFYSAYKDANDTSYRGILFNSVPCDENHFPVELLNESDNGNNILSLMMCPDLSSINYTLKADFLSEEFDLFQFELKTCSGSDTCANDSTINAYVQYTQFSVITANTYYDHNDLENPIKGYIDMSPSFIVNFNELMQITVPVVPTLIQYLDHTTQYTYSSGYPEIYTQNLNSNGILLICSIKLIAEMYTVEQQISYQPIMNNTRMLDMQPDYNRVLDSETTNTTKTVEEENHNFFDKTFFIMAQLGGLYSFFKLVFGSICNKIYQQMQTVDLLNRYNLANANKKTHKMSKNRQISRIHIEEEKKSPNQGHDLELSVVNEGGRNQDSSFHRSNEPDDHHQLMDQHHNQIERSRVTERSDDYIKHEYSYWEGIKYSLSCKNHTNIDQNSESSIMDFSLMQFQKDLNKLNYEMDAINLLMSIKETKYAISNVMNTVIQMSQEVLELKNNTNPSNSQNSKQNKKKSKFAHKPETKMTHDNLNLKKYDENDHSISKNSVKFDEFKKQNSLKPDEQAENKTKPSKNVVPTDQILNITKIMNEEISQIMNESKIEMQNLNQIEKTDLSRDGVGNRKVPKSQEQLKVDAIDEECAEMVNNYIIEDEKQQ